MVFNIVRYWKFMTASHQLLGKNRNIIIWRNSGLAFLIFFFVGYIIAIFSATNLILALVLFFGSIYVLVSLALLMAFISMQRTIFSDAVIEATDTEVKVGMLNLNGFSRHVKNYIKAHPDKSYVIVQWDIDNFKIYNDLNGYQGGDELLRSIGLTSPQIIKSGLVFGHLDSDHFVILAEKKDGCADVIYNEINAMLSHLNKLEELTIHMGICAVDDPEENIATLCNHALIALQTIKGQYQEHYAWYREEMRKQMVVESSIIAEMESALLDGQFHVWFQPQVNYNYGKISGAEALVRWIHPEKGMISPGQFIPLFEKNGFITKLDRFVWEKACAFQREWIDSGHVPYPVSVNISRRDIYACDLVEVITSLTQKYRLPPELLHLEITESMYMSSPEQLNTIVQTLQEKGFIVEIDDFGSGYSSLNTLKDMRFDTLKMDLKFLAKSDNSERGGRIISAMIRMADWLDVEIIAEGVETKEQADFLKSMGCAYMQGYYFYKPMSEEDYKRILQTPDIARAEKSGKREFLKGALDFMDSSAQTTLIFNSFTGSALIADYHDGMLEVLRINERFVRMFQEAQESLKDFHRNLFDRFEPDQRAVLMDALDQTAEDGQENECIVCLQPLKPDQGKRWLNLRMRVISSKGHSKIVYMSVLDITAHRMVEELEKKLEMIFRNVPAGIVTFDLDDEGRISFQYISDFIYMLFHLNPDDYRVKDGHDANDFGITRAMTEEILADKSQGVHTFERLVGRRTDGTHFWLRSIMILRENQGQKTVYAMLSDVTGRYERNAQQAAILKAIPGGFIRYSCDAAEEVSYVSDGLLELLEITREEFSQIYHDRFSPMVYEEDRARVLGEIDDQIGRDGDSDMCKYRILTRSGQLRWVYDAAFVTTDSDGRRWFNVVILDLNRQTENEKWIS